MTPSTFKRIQAILSLTNARLAEVLGVSVRTVERWRSGTNPINPPVDTCMLILARLHHLWSKAQFEKFLAHVSKDRD